MNLILLFQNDFISKKKVLLKGRRHAHVLSIHKAQVGQRLKVGLLDGRMGLGEVTKLNKKILEMEVDLRGQPPAPLAVTLILALPRPIMLKRILFAVSSMGVKKVILLNTSRVEKSFWNSHLLKKEKYKEPLLLGLEQAGDTLMPEVVLRPRFKPFVEDELPSMTGSGLCLIAHPEGGRKCPKEVKKPVILAIGPEGGFIPFEVEKFLGLGFESVHIGERILRVETAVCVLLSKLF